MSKKIAVIINNLTMNGVTNVVFNYLANIDKTDIKIDLIVGSPAEDALIKKFSDIGIKTYVLGVRKKNPFKYYNDLLKLLKENKYDVFHMNCNSCTSVFELEVAKKAGIKNIIAHSHNTKGEHQFLHKLFKNRFNKLKTNGIACSKEAGEWLFNDGNYILLNNAIDVSKFAFNDTFRNEIRTKYNIGNDEILIGNIGHFDRKQKNQIFLIDLFDKHLKNLKYKLMFIGDGEDFENYKTKAKELGLEDKIIFIKNTTEVNKFYSAFDVFCLPSLHEGLPLVSIEAQCTGEKVIVSDNVSKECGLTNSLSFVSIDNEDEWAKCLKGITLDADRNKISKENIKEISNKSFNIKEEANKLKALYLS